MVLYEESNIPLTSEAMQEISNELEKKLEQEISDTILRSQKEYECDYLNFYNAFRIKYPDLIKKLDWSQKYSKANSQIHVKVNLKDNNRLDYNPKKSK